MFKILKLFLLTLFLCSCSIDQDCIDEFGYDFCMQPMIRADYNMGREGYKVRMAKQCMRDGAPEYECIQILMN